MDGSTLKRVHPVWNLRLNQVPQHVGGGRGGGGDTGGGEEGGGGNLVESNKFNL